MIKRDILAEAIAEAKVVKETAIENAKAALTESFAPHLKSMLSAKLQEMETEDLEEENFIPEEAVNENEQVDELDELLKEIDSENELDETKKEDEAEEEVQEADPEKDAESTEEDEELDIEDMSEEDLKSFIEDVINDMIETGELEPGEGHESEEENPEGEEIDIEKIEGEEQPEEVDLDEMLKIGEELEDESLSDELDEAYQTIETLRTQISEVKVLNAKLLYSNKIFQSKTLTEGKKLQVLHAFEKATTIKEAKATYEILKENLDTKTISKPQFRGAASKTITPIKESKQPIVEVENQYARWKTLAGLD